jgi:transposase
MATSHVISSHSIRFFCGIDVAKDKHVACVIDTNNIMLSSPKSFANSEEGFRRLREILDKLASPKSILVAMEATGHYWYSLHDFLSRQGYAVVILNPIQTSQEAKKAIRKCKTDKKDSLVIATIIKNGKYNPAHVPSEEAMICRQLSRLRYEMIHTITRTKQLLWSRIHPVWPEYEPLFADPFGSTGRQLLHRASTPQDLLTLSENELAEFVRKTSRGKYGPIKTNEILLAAKNSVGMQRGLEGFRIGIRLLLDQLEASKKIKADLEEEIKTKAASLPDWLLTLPGITPSTAVSLFGELDPIRHFKSPEQLVAFAGLDTNVFQTGTYEKPHRQITKRGSPFLRRTLWQMAFQASQHEGDLRKFYLRRRKHGQHHLAAVTATALRLCHIVWRIMTDERPYLPNGRPQKTH